MSNKCKGAIIGTVLGLLLITIVSVILAVVLTKKPPSLSVKFTDPIISIDGANYPQDQFMPPEADYNFDTYITGVSTFEGYFAFQFIYNNGTRTDCSDTSLVRTSGTTSNMPSERK